MFYLCRSSVIIENPAPSEKSHTENFHVVVAHWAGGEEMYKKRD